MINDRMISRDIILKYRLGFCTTGKYEKRIIIPSYDKNGEVNYFVGRNYDIANKRKHPYDNPKSDKDRIIFNEGFVNWDSTVYLVEGAFEMLSFPVNIIPMLGKTISTTLFLKLKEMKPDVVVLLDPDAYKNAIELYYMLHDIYVGCEERVKIVKIPFEKDMDELRKKRGISEVIKSLRSARGLTVDDYFINKLAKPYDKQGTRRYSSNSKYFGWESNSTRNTL
jgi:DNA primase